MTTFQRHIIWRLLFATLVTVSACSLPITLAYIFQQVPTSLLYSKNIGTVIYGILPTVVYSAGLPIGLAIAVTWYYDKLVSDHEVVAAYSAGYSSLKLIAPAITLAAFGTALGLLLSCVVAPDAITRFVDLNFYYEHNLSPSALDEKNFYRYKVDGDQYMIYFDHRLGNGYVADIFLREIDRGGTENITTADVAQFVETERQSYLYLIDGVVQLRKRGEAEPRMTRFNHLWLATGLRGSEPPIREWSSAGELGPAEFFTGFKELNVKSIKEWDWESEALRRFGVPGLMIPYALIGIGLVLRGFGTRRDTWWRLQAICLTLVINHGAIVVAVQLPRVDLRFTWVVVCLMALEALGSLVLLRYATSISSGQRPGLRPPWRFNMDFG
ncbi:MAG TPA: LptF/LptG family permease [Xanthobacteraceae bacterium]|nr:LptF/LptG family permease [Xanthobacteraceae bacterium]